MDNHLSNGVVVQQIQPAEEVRCADDDADILRLIDDAMSG